MEANVLYDYIVEGHSQEKVGQRYGISQADVSEIVRKNGLNKQASGNYQSGYHRGFYKNYKHIVTVEFIQQFLRSNYNDFEVYFATSMKELKSREQKQQQIRQQQLQEQRQREQRERDKERQRQLKEQQERERQNALRQQQLERQEQIRRQQLAFEQELKRQEEERRRQQLAIEQERKRQEEERRRQQLAKEQERKRLIAEKKHIEWMEEGKRLFQEKKYEQSLQYTNKSYQLLPVLGNLELLIRLKLVYKQYGEAFTLVNNFLIHNSDYYNKKWVRLRARANQTDFALFNKDIQFLIAENYMTNHLYSRFVYWSDFTNASVNTNLVDAYNYCIERNHQVVNSTVGLAYLASVQKDWKTFFHYINEFLSLATKNPEEISNSADRIFRLLNVVANDYNIEKYNNVVELRIVTNKGKDSALLKRDMEYLMEQGEGFDKFSEQYIVLANTNNSPDWFYVKQIYVRQLEQVSNKLAIYKALLQCLYNSEQYEEYAKYEDAYATWFAANIDIHKYKLSEFYSNHSANWQNAISYAHVGDNEKVIVALVAMTSHTIWEFASVEQVSLLNKAVNAVEEMENKEELLSVKQLLKDVEEFRKGEMRAKQFYGMEEDSYQDDYKLKYDAANKVFQREPLLKDKIKNALTETYHNIMYHLRR